MLTRRPHPKVKTGCNTCKSRRVKCDETGPPCTSCAARNTPCSYSTTTGERSTQTPATARNDRPSPSTSNVDVPIGSSSTTRLLELRFLHQFTIASHKPLTDLFETPDLWQVSVVKDAFNHDFLLNGIFSLVALEEAYENPDARAALSIKSSEYLEAALTKFRALIGNITIANDNAMFAFSAILCMTTVVRLTPSETVNLSWPGLMDKLGAFLECLQGTRKIVVASGLWCKPGPFHPYLTSLQTGHDLSLVDPDVEEAVQRLSSLQAGNVVNVSPDANQVQLYRKAIESLRGCWCRKILVLEWLNDMGKPFQTELRKEDCMAKLILAHWGAAMHTLDHLWWVPGIGRNIVEFATRDLDSGFAGVSLDFLDAIRWLRRQVGLEVE